MCKSLPASLHHRVDHDAASFGIEDPAVKILMAASERLLKFCLGGKGPVLVLHLTVFARPIVDSFASRLLEGHSVDKERMEFIKGAY